MKTRLLINILFGMVAAAPLVSYAQFTSEASLAAFAPLLPAGDKPLAVQACTRLSVSDSPVVQVKFKCPKGTIETDSSVSNNRAAPMNIKLIVTDLNRLRIAGKVREFGPLQSVHQLDLNDDAMPDYVLELGTESKQLLFLLSNGRSYDWQMISQLRSPALAHLYTDAEGKKTLLTTRLSSDAARTPVGSAHLVYDIVQFSKASNQFLYSPTDNYPVWVAYSGATSAAPGSLHKPTTAIARDVIRKATRAPLDKQRAGRMQVLG